MASSSAFRGRRIAEPVPIQRRPFPRDTRERPSFSDVAAALQNVGEVKSALEAAEARINEANAELQPGLEEGIDHDLREIFSETQRYGRVARFELRPDMHRRLGGHDTVGDSRQGHLTVDRARHARPPPQLSPPSRETVSNPRPTSHHLSQNGIEEFSLPTRNPAFNPAYLPVPLSRDPALASVNIEQEQGRPTSASLLLEDSLEVPVLSSSQVDSRPNSSLGLRRSIGNNSTALSKLKERIRKQKENSTRMHQARVMEDAQEEPPVLDVSHIAVNDTTSVAVEEGESLSKPLSKRKIAAAPAAPAYRGFSEVEQSSRPAATREEESRLHSTEHGRAGRGRALQPNARAPQAGRAHKRPVKPNQELKAKKGGPKVQRITAPRRHVDVITTTSWRTGQETVKRILGPTRKQSTSHRPAPADSRAADTITSTSSDSTLGRGHGLEWKADQSEEIVNRKMQVDSVENGERDGADADLDASRDESEPSRDSRPKSEASDVEAVKGLQESQVLSREAKGVLSDLKLSSDDSDQDTRPPPRPGPVESSRAKPAAKRPRPGGGVKRKALATQQKQEPAYPKRKSRHYDADQVKKYMAKQVAQRKQRMKDERLMKQKAEEERKKKLEELFNKQKKSLAANLAIREHRRHGLGETFSKVPSGLHFIPSYRHPFEEETSYGEDVGESDKENFDVASFRGLPSQWRNGDAPQSSLRRSSESRSAADSSEHSLSGGDASELGAHDAHRAVRTVVISTQPAADSPARSTYPGFSQDSLEEGRLLGEQVAAEPVRETSGAAAAGAAVVPERDTAEPDGSPNKADRIAAIREKAAELKERLEAEARRLGLSFQSSREHQLPAGLARQSDTFAGVLPGVNNLRQQADLNHELKSMNVAATRIQAAYRGHSVRQGLDWRLPSGRSFGAFMREAQHKSDASQTGAERTDASPNSTSWETVVHNDGLSASDGQRSPSVSYAYSASSVKYESSQKDSVQLPSEKRLGGNSSARLPPSSNYRRSPPPQVKKPWEQTSGDRHSVINIYTRDHPSLRVVQEDSAVRPGSETASLLEVSRDEDTVSLLDGADELPTDRTSHRTATAGEDEDEYEDDFTGSDGERTITKVSPPRASPDRDTTLRGSYSESFVSPEPSRDRTLESGPLSPTPSRTSLSPPDRTSRGSSRLSPSPEVTERQPPPDVPPDRPHPSLFFPSRAGGDRLSPGSLDHRMTAELNRLESMEASVRQLTDIEQARAVSLAQQETVSLAQILKARQLSHSRDMENLQLKARQEALEAAKQLEEARRAAADAAAQAAQTIAQFRTETATTISESADRLVKVQTEAAKTTVEASKQVQEARTSAAQSRLEAANQYSEDLRAVVVSAASAAAEAAVKSSIAKAQKTPKSRASDSYTDYTPSSYTRTQTSRSVTERTGGSGAAYTTDEFDSYVDSGQDRTQSLTTNHSADLSAARDRGSTQSLVDGSESIPEDVEQSASASALSEDEESRARKKKPKLDETVNLEESFLSSRTVTDDERDFRFILPSESHRRGLGRSRRSGSVGSDVGTVSYSSDENHDGRLSDRPSQKLPSDAAPFSAEDSFSKFTAVMVGLMKEEEARAKHLEALLRLREEALKEKTQAEMAWLELQKKRRDKASDDVMPSIRKRQRGVRMRQQAEQAEIKRLMAANRAASYERRLLLLQQEEIARLRKTTQKIRDKVKGNGRGAGPERTGNRDGGQSGGRELEGLADSAAGVDEIAEELDKSADMTSRSHSQITEDIQSPVPSHDASIAEELSSFHSPTASGTQTFPTYSSQEQPEEGAADRKRLMSEEESDERAPAFKDSPSVSDSTVMKKLKKLRRHSSERYLTQREQKLREKRSEAEKLLENKKKLLEWERRLDEEENQLKNLLNEALGLKTPARRKDSVTSEEGERPERRSTVSSPSVTKTATSSYRSDQVRSAEKSPSTSEQIKTQASDHRSLADSSSVPDDIPSASRSLSRSKSRDSSIPEESIPTPSASQSSSVPEDIPSASRSLPGRKSRDSSIPEESIPTPSASRNSSVPEDIADEYGNDTFESLDTSSVPNHSTPMRAELSPQKGGSSAVSRRSSRGDGEKSEEDTSYTETSDHSDIESRVRQLRDQLEHRKGEARRLLSERKRQRKSLLRAQEARLRKQLQAVELVISNTKADLDKERTDAKPPPSPRSLSESHASQVRARGTESTSPSEYHSEVPRSVELRNKTSSSRAPRLDDVETSVKDSEESDSVAESLPSVKERAPSDSEPHDESDESARASDRDRTCSDSGRSFSEADRPSAKAEDASWSSENEARSVSKKSERSSDEDERRSVSSGEVRTASDASRSSRRTASIPEQLSRTASEADSYSNSFESDVTGRKNRDEEMAEHSGTAQQRRRVPAKDSSEISEDIPEDLSEKSLSEDLPSKSAGSGAQSRDSTIADEVEESEILSIHSDTDLGPGDYTPDFEQTETKETGKSEASAPSAKAEMPSQYSADFEPSETKSVREDEPSAAFESSRERSAAAEDLPSGAEDRPGRDEDLSSGAEDLPSRAEHLPSEVEEELDDSSLKASSGREQPDAPRRLAPGEADELYPSDFEPSSADEQQAKKGGEERLPDIGKRTEGVGREARHEPTVPRLEIQEPSDEDSIAEELPSGAEELPSGAEDLPSSVKDQPSDTEELPRRAEKQPSEADELPIGDEERPRVDEAVDRVTDQLTSHLFTEAIGCITHLYQSRRQVSGELDDGRDGADGHRLGLVRHREESPESDELPKTEENSVGQSRADEKSVSGLDFRTTQKQIAADASTRKEDVVADLTDRLLQEAAAQMISIMRKKREKNVKAAPRESKPTAGESQEAKSPVRLSPSPPPQARFEETMPPRLSPEGSRSPHGSPTGGSPPPLDGHELINKLSKLEQLHDEIEGVLRRKDGGDDEDEDDIALNQLQEPTSDDDDEIGRPRRGSVLYVVPHSVAEVNSLVASALSVFFAQKSAGLPITDVEPPPELLSNGTTNDLRSTSERVYKRLVFDLTGDIFRELLSEETPAKRPSWMKARRRRKTRFHSGSRPLEDELGFLPIVRERVAELVGLSSARPSVEAARRKTFVKMGKKDFVDAILIQELREEEPQWVDYDDDELAVKFQVADAIFESLLSETVMVMNTVQDRRDARREMLNL